MREAPKENWFNINFEAAVIIASSTQARPSFMHILSHTHNICPRQWALGQMWCLREKLVWPPTIWEPESSSAARSRAAGLPCSPASSGGAPSYNLATWQLGNLPCSPASSGAHQLAPASTCSPASSGAPSYNLAGWRTCSRTSSTTSSLRRSTSTTGPSSSTTRYVASKRDLCHE